MRFKIFQKYIIWLRTICVLLLRLYFLCWNASNRPIKFIIMLIRIERNPTTHFHLNITLKQHCNYYRQQNNGCWALKWCKKLFTFLQANLNVSHFLASLELKRNTFNENKNIEYNQITYHILQFRKHYSNYLLQHGVHQTIQISKL